MYKNVPDQRVFIAAISISDGSPKTEGVEFYIAKDTGVQTPPAGEVVHGGNGHWRITFTQEETNTDVLSLLWTGPDVVTNCITLYPVAKKVQDYQTELSLLNRLDVRVSTRADANSLYGLTQIYTAQRAAYLDNLAVGGLVASQADVSAITQAQRVRIVVPRMMERPDEGSVAYQIWIHSYDNLHKAKDLDTLPIIAASNNAGQDRSINLGTVVKPTGTTGLYYVEYTVAADHAIEGLIFLVNATDGGITTAYSEASIVVDTTAVDFTAADRLKLDTLYNKRPTGSIADQDTLNGVGYELAQHRNNYTAERAAKLDNLDATITSRLAATGYTAPPTVDAIVAGVESEQGKLHETLVRAENTDELMRELTEVDGAGNHRLTAKALEQAPVGESVWSTEQRDAVLEMASTRLVTQSRINTTTTPWRLELLVDQTIVKAYECYDINGAPITSTDAIIAKYVEVV
jgi:hypothetical protein